MNIAIVENDYQDYEKIANFLYEYFHHINYSNYAVELFSNGYDFLESNHVFDAVFMDIEMPGIDGLKTATKIREKDKDVSIVFVTNMSQYAINGYKVRALDFCLKPVTYPDVKMILDNLMEKLQKVDETFLSFKSNGMMIRIKQANIESIEMLGHDAIVRYYSDKKIREVQFRSSMKDIMTKIDCPSLIGASSGALVNLDYVVSFDSANSICTLASERKVIISRSHKKNFILKFSKY